MSFCNIKTLPVRDYYCYIFGVFLQASLMSDTGSYRSDAEDTFSPTRNSERSMVLANSNI